MSCASPTQEEAPSAVCALRNGRMWDSPGSSSLPTGLSRQLHNLTEGYLHLSLSCRAVVSKLGTSPPQSSVRCVKTAVTRDKARGPTSQRKGGLGPPVEPCSSLFAV